MNKIFIFISLAFLYLQVNGQKFELDTIQYNGSINTTVNLVILGDGYQNQELEKFVSDSKKFSAAFFATKPYSNYSSNFNVFAIKVASTESGASHPGTASDVVEPAHPVSKVDNYFGSTFDGFGIHRLLIVSKGNKVINVLANNFPAYDLVVILVNSPYYGGSGGEYAVASMHTSSSEIAIHEIGHSFVDLRDEYYAGDSYAREGINMTKQTDPALVRWGNWYGDNSIGIYQHCCGGNSSQWYKPHTNCKMERLGAPFCSVCTEGTIERIHALTDPIDSYFSMEISEETKSLFSLNLIKPSPNTLNVKWFLNDSIIALDSSFIYINNSDLLLGTNKVQVFVEDTTEMLRVINHSHIYNVSWEFNYTSNKILEFESVKSVIDWNVYPNPTFNNIWVNIEKYKGKDLSVAVYDLGGHKVIQEKLNRSPVLISLSGMINGIYIVNVEQNGTPISSKRVLKQ